jgi:hypothetical protein
VLKTLWAEVKQGKIELLELADLPEGTKVLVTLVPTQEMEQWLQDTPRVGDDIWDGSGSSGVSHDIWDNIEDKAEDKVEVPSLLE